MRTRTVIASVAVIALGVFMAPGVALAQKKGSGTTDPCKAAPFAPSFINIWTTTVNRASVNQVRLADRSGACQVPIASGAFGDDLLLIDLGNGQWRTVWTSADRLTVIVRDHAVSADATTSVLADRALTMSEPVLSLEASGAGNFLISTRPANDYLSAPKLWRVDPTAQSNLTLLGSIGATCSPLFSGDFAVGPDGDTLYVMSSTEPDGVRTYSLRTFSLADPGLAAKLQSCESSDPPGGELQLQGGNTNVFAVGQCGSGFTCVAIERVNVRGIPCTPDYYRTDVYNLDVRSALPSIVQLAYPAWGSSGELFGRETGSTSKNACTAKIYAQAVRHTVSLSGGNVSVSPAALIGPAEALDAPNPVASPVN